MSNTHDKDDGRLAPSSGIDAQSDLLSDVLRYVQLKGQRVFSCALGDRYRVTFIRAAASFHVVKEGEVVFEVVGSEPFTASLGDVVLIPRATDYSITDIRRSSTKGVATERTIEQVPSTLEAGEGDVAARTISATFQFENAEAASPLLGLLPDVVHIVRKVDESAAMIGNVAEFLVLETVEREPGATLMISRVIDILVIRCIRSWAKSVGARQGWVGALSDARMSRAVAALHRDPVKDWTVADLASIAGMSRSSFAERFLATVGEPPLRYLHRWRLTMADEMLRRSSAQVKDVARSVGYDSDAAFSRAYKTMFGSSPRVSRTS